MKTFKFQEVIDFIKNQPDKKEIDFSSPSNREGNCGCLMVQFGREKGLEFDGVSWCGNEFLTYDAGDYVTVAHIEDFPKQDIVSYVSFTKDGIPRTPDNYGDLKKVLKTKHE